MSRTYVKCFYGEKPRVMGDERRETGDRGTWRRRAAGHYGATFADRGVLKKLRVSVNLAKLMR